MTVVDIDCSDRGQFESIAISPAEMEKSPLAIGHLVVFQCKTTLRWLAYAIHLEHPVGSQYGFNGHLVPSQGAGLV